MTTVYLVRHAKSVGNTERIFQGCSNLGLSVEGQAQLPQLAERFREVLLDAVYSSPLQRAVQTAQAVNQYHRLPIQTDKGLCEIFAGQWEMQRFSDLPVAFPAEWRLWTEDESHFCAPGGESILQVHERMSRTIDRIAAKNEGRTVAIVSHGCALRCYLCHALGLPIEKIGEIPLSKNTAVSRVIYNGGRIQVDYYDDLSHLEDREKQEVST
ncbi:MAG: histidine phosphatase family protein [Oscillospiraceae bacterium]|nr:histidine phosphatase family protein [Oscillospiraceae bacterium]